MEEKNMQQPEEIKTEDVVSPEDSFAQNEGTIFKDKDSKVGPLIGSIIVILIIVVGGVYFLGTKVEEVKDTNQEDFSNEENIVDEVESIQAELDNLNLDDVDADLNALDAELQSI